MPDAPDADASAVAAAAPVLNLPPFTATDAAPWFHRVEALFRLRTIQSTSRKPDYVIGAHPPEVFSQISDWLMNQGTDAILYDDLKHQIIERCSLLGFPNPIFEIRITKEIFTLLFILGRFCNRPV